MKKKCVKSETARTDRQYFGREESNNNNNDNKQTLWKQNFLKPNRKCNKNTNARRNHVR